MTWFGVALLTVGSLLLVWLFNIYYQTYIWRGVPPDAFPNLLRKFMIAHDDGATCLLERTGGPATAIRVTRKSGDDTRCDLVVDISRTLVAETKLSELEDCFHRLNAKPLVPANEPGVLLRIECHVSNFWDAAAGAAPAHMARKAFEVLGVGPGTRYRYRMSGPASRRSFARVHDV